MAFETVFVLSDDNAALNELCAGARGLAPQVTAVMFGDEAQAKSISACGADTLIYCPVDDTHAPEDYSAAIAAEIKKHESALLMVHNSIRGRCLAGKIGVALDTSVLTAVGEMALKDGEVVCRRTVYGGTAQREERFKKNYGIVTLPGGVFEAPETPAEAGKIEKISGEAETGIRRVAREEKKEGGVNLVAAKRIIDVGRGLAKEEDLEMCRKLAEVIDAEVGCSRPVAENN